MSTGIIMKIIFADFQGNLISIFDTVDLDVLKKVFFKLDITVFLCLLLFCMHYFGFYE